MPESPNFNHAFESSPSQPRATTELRDTLKLSTCAYRPFDHQVIGIDRLTAQPALLLADDMGAGKTLQVVVSAQVLFKRGLLTRVLVMTPNALRSVWTHPDSGEIRVHQQSDVPIRVTWFHNRLVTWTSGSAETYLDFIVTSYEYLRGNPEQLKRLGHFVCSKKTLLVLDESSAVKNARSLQTKTCQYLRERCGRVVLLNGTPISHSPLDLYSQANLLSRDILSCKTAAQFRARYAIMGGFKGKEIVGWHNLRDLQTRLKPFVLRRLKEHCLDLPPKLPPSTIAVPLSRSSWSIYCDLVQDMLADIEKGVIVEAAHAFTRAIRLAQVTSGFVSSAINEATNEILAARIIGSEKLDALLAYLEDPLSNDQDFRAVIFCRFRIEARHIAETLTKRFPAIPIGVLIGGQTDEERATSLSRLHPKTAHGQGLLVSTMSAGSKGLNLAGANVGIYVSCDYSYEKYVQSVDRIYRQGQTRRVSYVDFIATGPSGQRTIDHDIMRSRVAKHDLAQLTLREWVSLLTLDTSSNPQ